jgi:hypothetical protein
MYTVVPNSAEWVNITSWCYILCLRIAGTKSVLQVQTICLVRILIRLLKKSSAQFSRRFECKLQLRPWCLKRQTLFMWTLGLGLRDEHWFQSRSCLLFIFNTRSRGQKKWRYTVSTGIHQKMYPNLNNFQAKDPDSDPKPDPVPDVRIRPSIIRINWLANNCFFFCEVGIVH